MKKLSEISKRTDGQPMFKLLEKVKNLEQQGKNIIHFEIGCNHGLNEKHMEKIKQSFTSFLDMF